MAYRIVKDQLIDEGNARENLATFCQTYMEPKATEIMAETMQKNAIDKEEYPRTAELENRCVNIIANLWHGQKDEDYIETSTVGSSKGCMLGGLAMKFAWRERAKKLGLDINAHKPNLVISSGYQVCGFLVTLFAFIISFFPTPSLPASSHGTYMAILIISFLIVLTIPFIIFQLTKKHHTGLSEESIQSKETHK